MTLASLLLFAGALLIAAGSPGPSIAALVSRVIARGIGDVLPFLAAMWVGEVIWLTLTVWGLAAVAQSFAGVFLVIKWSASPTSCSWLGRCGTRRPCRKARRRHHPGRAHGCS